MTFLLGQFQSRLHENSLGDLPVVTYPTEGGGRTDFLSKVDKWCSVTPYQVYWRLVGLWAQGRVVLTLSLLLLTRHCSIWIHGDFTTIVVPVPVQSVIAPVNKDCTEPNDSDLLVPHHHN